MSETKFVLGIICGMILAPIGYFSIIWLLLGTPLVYTSGQGASIKVKMEIAQSIDRSKIIFIGGSSVGNGISARLVQETTGIPAVNMGLYATLGPEYMMEQAKRCAKRGDLVVLVLEYGLYDWAGDCPYWADHGYLPIIFSQDVDFVRSRSLDEQFHFAIRLENGYILDCLRAKMDCEMNTLPGAEKFYSSHNRWGDDINHTEANRPAKGVLGQTPYDPIWHLSHALSPKAKAFPCIASFVQWAHSSGVKVVTTFPNVAYNTAYNTPEAHETEEVITQFYASIHVPVIGHARDAMFPPERFFDTNYHMCSDAIHDRTAQLIPKLTPFLPSK